MVFVIYNIYSVIDDKNTEGGGLEYTIDEWKCYVTASMLAMEGARISVVNHCDIRDGYCRRA